MAHSAWTPLTSGRGKAQEYSAVRVNEAKAKGVADPDDFTLHTGVKDPNEPFRFSFPDLTGKTVSNTDASFRGTVVLINVTGSWCLQLPRRSAFPRSTL